MKVSPWGIAIFALLGLTIIIYYPALSGQFYLDDYQNLKSLSYISTQGYLQFILDGHAGPAGRPISLLSFALQHQQWPENPFAFKAVNLFIHLVSGLLIFLICKQLVSRLELSKNEKFALSAIAAGLWLLHPMHISTVLYVVQRMTQLSALFMLLGIFGYLHFRVGFRTTARVRDLAGMSICVGGGMVLAIFSKENGILLPLFLVVIETTIFSGMQRDPAWYKWAWVFLGLPLLMLAIYLGLNIDSVISSYSLRDFTISERLMTQAVVICTYVKNLVLPYYGLFSLYNDDFTISSGLLSPPTTLFAIASILFASIFAILTRKRFAVVSFAVLWFLGGHLLESSYISLELYFEHRNYIPSLGIFFFIGWIVVMAWRKFSSKLLLIVPVSGYFCLVLLTTFLELSLWNNPYQQAFEWARLHPASKRAQDNLASVYLKTGEIDKAMQVYDRLENSNPSDFYPKLRKIVVKNCIKKVSIDQEEWIYLLEQAKASKWDGYSSMAELDELVMNLQRDNCSQIGIVNIIFVIVALAYNPEYGHMRDELHVMATDLAVKIGDANSAIENINEAIRISSTPSRLMYKIKILMAMKSYDDAKISLGELKKLLSKSPGMRLVYNKFISETEKILM